MTLSTRMPNSVAGCLIEREGVGIHAPEVHATVHGEPGALGQQIRAERPRAIHCQLLVDDIGCHVERRGPSLADKARAAPGPCCFGAIGAWPGLAGAIQRGVGTLTMCQLTYRFNRRSTRWIERDLGAELAREFAPFGRQVDGDDARAHGCR